MAFIFDGRVESCYNHRKEEQKVQNNKIKERLSELRKLMRKEAIDAYIILTDDFHASEYVGDYFKCREYISGFTGSAGTVVVLEDEAGLWTDGRYFLQAEQQLENTEITLFKSGEDGVPTIEEYIKKKLSSGNKVGIDGRTLSVTAYKKWEKEFGEKGIQIYYDIDYIGAIWKDRPELSCENAWELNIEFAGKSRKEKIKALREKMQEQKSDAAIITSLDDIAWLLNLRGNDVKSTPVILSHLLINRTSVHFYVQSKAINSELKQSLEKDNVVFHEYLDIYQAIEGIEKKETIYIDPERLNVLLYKNIQKQEIDIKEGNSLTELQKAIKNQIEIDNFRLAHKKDAIAVIKFLYWLKTNIGKEKITEISAAEKLEQFRRAQSNFVEPSFDTITGYGAHGAIVHYSATKESDIELEPHGFVLIDSGGHYLEGTTDITRTIALGGLTQQQKHHYTLVLKGNIRLSNAVFKYGCAGINFDYLAREALWKEGLDYNHGTGHGVGYLLNVHEGPNGFRYRVSSQKGECCKLEEGMVTSNEPGLYIAGEYGIRIENLMLCKKSVKNEYGQFMCFETLTLVPMERDAIIIEEMTEEELDSLNQYHKRVYETVKDELSEEEREWLYHVTEPLKKA